MTLVVLEAGVLTTVQDSGRSGVAHLGVPRAGVLDAPAAALANRLVGNDETSAVLEVTLGGLAVRAEHGCWVAVTGAPGRVRVDGRAVAFESAVRVGAGAVLSLDPPEWGVRTYVAVAGGIAVHPVLGSRSTDTLAWVGPPQVAAGTVLPVGPAMGEPRPLDTPPVRRPGPLRLHGGPRADWFAPGAFDRLCGSSYTVTAASNRIGLRLDGPPLERVRMAELPSEGMVLGAVQVPPDGRPVVFLHDHPVTGGYPVVAVVDPADLWRCAQARPGESVTFSRDR